MTAKGREPKPTFEKAMARIEEIVAEMEAGTLDLDRMMARFEEGNTLIRFCGEKLNEVEKRIEVLVKDGDAVRAEPFDEGTAEAAPTPGSAD